MKHCRATTDLLKSKSKTHTYMHTIQVYGSTENTMLHYLRCSISGTGLRSSTALGLSMCISIMVITQLVSLSVGWSVHLSVSWSVNQSVRQSGSRSVSPSVRQSISQLVSLSINQLVSLSISQLVIPSVSQVVSQLFGQLICGKGSMTG